MIPIVEFKTDLVTDVKQSKELAEILPVPSADCCYNLISVPGKDMYMLTLSSANCECTIPAWSAGRLINIIKDNVKKFELSNVDNNYTLRIYFSRVYKDFRNDESLINVLISAIKYFKYYNIKIKIRDYEENTNSF